MNARRPIEILLVEDNPGDARLAWEAIREARVSHNMRWVSDGVEALAYLRKEGKFSDAPRPDLILLDLNLPRKDGREVPDTMNVSLQMQEEMLFNWTSGFGNDKLGVTEDVLVDN